MFNLTNINHTTLIIIITVIISIMAWQSQMLYNRLIFYPPAVKQGQFYRLLSYGFIHADGMHLLFNMFTLYFFGQVMESFYQKYLGTFGFFIFYLLAIIFSIIPSYLKNINNKHYLSLGASGGVSAVVFAYILISPWTPLYLFGVLGIPAIIFAIGYVAYSIYAHQRNNSNVNHLAHLWGALFGVIATIALDSRVAIHFLHSLFNPNF